MGGGINENVLELDSSDSNTTWWLYPNNHWTVCLKKKKTKKNLAVTCFEEKKKRISEIFVLLPLFVVCFWYFSVALPLLPLKWPDIDDILFTISYPQNAGGAEADVYHHKATF